MIKVVFLDIDGVLNSGRFSQNMMVESGVNVFAEGILDAFAVRRLRSIVDRSGALVVLSSSWRTLPDMKRKALDQLLRMGVAVFDQTPVLKAGFANRGDEIAAWLRLHPSVERYVILDDDDDVDDSMKDHLVQTTFWNGLQRKHIKRALAVLGN